MTYDAIGTQGGVPSGTLLQNETVSKSNQKFNVHTYIRYVDDSFDGTAGGSPVDTVPVDYKEAKVEVTWVGVQAGHGVKVFSKFVPDGAETNLGGGTFRLNVLDGSGAGLSGTAVHIVNNNVTPHIDISTYADSYGSVLLTGMPAGDRNYQISVAKDGYEPITTSPPYPTTSYDPVDVNASVIASSLNTKGIIIDHLSGLNIHSRDFHDQVIPNAHFNLKGGRIIGNDHVTKAGITNYNQNLVTDAGGDNNVTNISPGKYNIVLNEPGYTLAGANINFPLSLIPGQSLDVTLLLAGNSTNSVIVTIKDSITKQPIAGANVRLYNATGTDITMMTGQMGQVYFPPNTDPPTTLSSGNYNLSVTGGNHQNYSGTVMINQLTQKSIEIAPL